MQCTSICSPLEGKEMGKGVRGDKFKHILQFSRDSCFSNVSDVVGASVENGPSRTRWDASGRDAHADTATALCRRRSSCIWSVDQHLVNADFSSCFGCCVSLLPSPELPIHLSFPHFLLFCSHLRSDFRLLWWPNGFVISASWLQMAVIWLSGALQGRNALLPSFFCFVFLICFYFLYSLFCVSSTSNFWCFSAASRQTSCHCALS